MKNGVIRSSADWFSLVPSKLITRKVTTAIQKKPDSTKHIVAIRNLRFVLKSLSALMSIATGLSYGLVIGMCPAK